MNKHILAAEIAAFEKQKEELLKHHNGKFVVFKDGQLQGSFDTFDNAAKDAIRRFRDSPFLIRRVGEAEEMAMPASVAFRPFNANC